MKTSYRIAKVLTLVVSIFWINLSFAQTGVLDPDDPVVIYNSAAPPATPAYGKLAKWVKTNRVSFNTSSFKAYYYKGMAFRLKFPKSYKDSINTGKKYPLFVFFHGVGEKGSVYDNEYQLYHGGQKFMTAVDNGSFDGFLLYPQTSSSSGGFSVTHLQLINELINNYFVPEIHVDINRIIVDGLSGGGQATWKMLKTYPSLVAAGLPISAVSILDMDAGQVNALKFTPIWLFQGGLDKAPAPYTARTVLNAYKLAGSNISYTEYPTQGHGCWNSAWADPGFIPFINKAHKANPWPVSGRTEYCPGDPISQVIGVTAGFDGYEWRKDGVVIPGANSNTYTATSIGVYDCRIKRDTAWSVWSPVPVVIKLKGATVSPDITVNGPLSNVIPSPDGNTSVQLQVPEGYATYNWQKEGSPAVLSTTRFLTASEPGNYKVKVTEEYGCSSDFSNLFAVVDANGAGAPLPATGFTAKEISKTEIKLDWLQSASPANNETGFEIYRSEAVAGPYVLVATTQADASHYTDSDLNTDWQYFYKIRAVNNNGASAVSDPAGARTMADVSAPSAPGNLRTLSSSHNSVELIWDDATDDVAVVGYDIYVNGVRYYETTENHFTVYNLQSGPTYTFRVKAKDFAGNQSAFSNQATAQALLNGLSYKYFTYTGSWDNLPDFNAMEPDAAGVVPNVTIDNRTQSDNFAYLWEGYINIPVTGTYYFRTSSDAGSRVWLGAMNQTTGVYGYSETPLVNNDGLHTSKTVTSSAITLTAGHYPIAIAYYEETGSESMKLYWRTPLSSSYYLVPDSAFADTPIINGEAPSKPSALSAVAASPTQINLTWTDNSSNETGFEIWRTSDLTTDYAYVGSAAENATTFSDSYNLAPNTTYYYKIRAVGEIGESDLVSQYLEANWQFNNNYKDASGNGHTLVPTSGPTFDLTENREGTHSLKMNGTNHSVLINTADGFLKNAYSEKSIALWMKPTLTTGNRVIFDLGGSDDGIALKLDDNKLYVGIAGNNVRKSFSVPFTSTEWTHVAVVYEKKSLKLYLNGVEAGAINDLSFSTTTTTTNGSRIGLNESSNAFNSSSARFAGWLDNFTIYSTAITPDVVLAHMNNTAGVSNATTLSLPALPPTPENLQAAALSPRAVKLDWAFNAATTDINAIPAGTLRVEAEDYNYMNGISTENCNEGGKDVKSIDANDWMDYEINLPVAGACTVNFRVATNSVNTGQFQLRTSDETVLATLSVPKTGSTQTFTTVSATVSLPAGEQTLRVYALKNGWTFNWFEIETAAETDTITHTAQVSAIELYRSTGASDNYSLIASLPVSTVTYTDSSLLSNTTYSYKARAVGQDGYSIYSNEIPVATLNNVPVLNAVPDQLMRFGSTGQLEIIASDADADMESLTVQVTNLPSFATFVPGGNGGVITFSPASADNIGVYDNITVIAKDEHNGSDTVVFKLTVDENHKPVIAGLNTVTVKEKEAAQVKLSASDLNETDSLTWSFSSLPAFATPVITGDSATIEFAPGYADNGTYHIIAKVDDGHNGIDSLSIEVVVNDVNPNKTIYVNFTDGTYMAPAPWNNTGKAPAINDDFANLNDEEGVATGIGLRLLTTWTGINNMGANTGNNTGIYPDAVLRSSYYTNASRSIKIYGLAPSDKYSFSFLGSRANPTVGVVSTYTIGAGTVSLNAANNKQDTVVIGDVQPDADGTVTLLVANAAGSMYGYLNALVIRSIYEDGTVPARPRDLHAEAVNGTVKLSWTDAAYNETAYEIYRADNIAGPYSLLSVDGNSKDLKNYTDANVSGHATYYYAVRALNGAGASLYSDTVSVSTPNASPVLAAIENVTMQIQQTLTVNVAASDEPGDVITLTASGLPSFASFTDNGNGTGTIHIAPGNTTGQFDNITITASDNANASSSRQFNIVVANTNLSSAYINFNQTYAAPAPWNNMNSAPIANASISDLKDEAGLNTGMTLTLMDSWTAQTATGYTSGNDGGLYPDNVLLTSYYYGTANTDRTIKLSGLSVTKKYNLIFFASRNNYASSLMTRYTVAGQSVDLQVANNISTTVQINDISPDADGQILIKARAIAGPNAYIGSLIVQAYTPDVSNPAAPANLSATGIAKNKIQLKWQSVANTGYEVWRSMAANGTYTKLADVAANTTSFIDSGLVQSTVYYYKVKAVINGNPSSFSNYAGAQTVSYAINLNMNDGTVNSPAQSGYWNNTNALLADGYVLSNMINDQGQNTGINFGVTTTFSGFNYSGKVTGDNSGVYPDNVIKSFYYVNYADTARLKITGLTLGHSYNFVFYGNRQNPVTGVTTAYKIGNQIVTLDATNNTSATVKLTGIRPAADGSVSITIYGTIAGGFGYLNALSIEGTPAVAPDPALGVVNSALLPGTELAAGGTLLDAGMEAVRADVYPNPFLEDVTLRLNLPGNVDKFSILVADISGRIVYRKDIFNAQKGIWQEKIGLKGGTMPSGMYFVKLVGFPYELQESLKIVKP